MSGALPEYGSAKKCRRPDCPDTFQTSYGLAGGGMGVYEYCEVCERVVSKTIDRDPP